MHGGSDIFLFKRQESPQKGEEVNKPISMAYTQILEKGERKMKKILFFLMTIGLVLAMGMTTGYAQPMGPGMMGPGYDNPQQGGWNYCPYCGNYLGPEGGYGYGMGPGMMGGMMGRG